MKLLQEKNPQLAEALFKGQEAEVINFLDQYTANMDKDDPRAKAWKKAKIAGYTGLALLAIVLGIAGITLAGASALSKAG